MKIKLLKGFLAGIFAILFVCMGYVVKQNYQDIRQIENYEQKQQRACIDFSMYQK